MEAYAKREMEQMQFLGELEASCSQDSKGEPLSDDDVLRIIVDLTEGILYERVAGRKSYEFRTGGKVNVATFAMEAIDKFARTPEEGAILRKRLLKQLIKAAFHDAEADYLHQRVHEPKKLYDGHEAMDEVD